jgi:arylsulfatase A-like enzyme
VFAFGGGVAPAAAATRPNVLVIVTDDQRAGLSVMPFTTRWLRDGGTRYPRAFANTPLCCPARASIMTGLYAHNHGVLSNQSADQLDQDATIQKALHDAGYRTALVGKFLNQWELSTSPPNFDRFAIISNKLNGQLFGNDYYNGGLWNVNGAMRVVDEYSTRFVGRRAVSFLKAQEAQDPTPWFLFVAPAAPHLPARPEPIYAEAPIAFWPGNPATEELDLSDKPPWWQVAAISETHGRLVREQQYRALMSVDDLVERLAGTLRSLEETRRTLVLYVSDNGFAWGEHGRRGKTLPYAESVKVPMFIRWPGHIPSSSIDRRLVAHVDITPTIRAAVGLPADPAHPPDGRSLFDPNWERDRLLLEFFPTADSMTPQWASTWTPGYQYTEYYEADTGVVSFRELYDLAADRWQLDNLYGDAVPENDPSTEDTAALSATLARDHACAGVSCP